MKLGQPPIHHRVRQRHGCLGDPVAETAVGDRRLVPRLLLLLRQQLRLVRLGHIGRNDLEDAAAQHLQVAGTKVRRLLHQVAFGPPTENRPQQRRPERSD
jgi:hypothetical protein